MAGAGNTAQFYKVIKTLSIMHTHEATWKSLYENESKDSFCTLEFYLEIESSLGSYDLEGMDSLELLLLKIFFLSLPFHASDMCLY